MYGGAGNDGFILSGDYGQDYIDGGPGGWDMLFAGGSRALVVDLAAGTATGGGSSGSATLVNVEGAAGGRFADRLLGNAADNLFWGRAGNDWMSGGSGNDHLMSEQGNDTLTGGPGADEFRFAAPAGTADADRITDFVSGSDKIVLDGSFTTDHEGQGAAILLRATSGSMQRRMHRLRTMTRIASSTTRRAAGFTTTPMESAARRRC